MADYMKANGLQTAFQLLLVTASDKQLNDWMDEAGAEMHIPFKKEEFVSANSGLVELLQRIEAEASTRLAPAAAPLDFYFHKITIDGKDYENLSLFLFLSEHPAEHLNFPDFASYSDFLTNLDADRRNKLFGAMILRYNNMYLRDVESNGRKDQFLKSISDLEIIAMIMEMDLPLELRFKIQDIFVHWDTHVKAALPLLDTAYQVIMEFEPELEIYAENFITYWENRIEKLGGVTTFIEQLFPIENVPENPFGFELSVSFFRPFELGLYADLNPDDNTCDSPYEILLGIFYGEQLSPQNPYMSDSLDNEEAYINALKLLSDRRRFEIMSYLSTKPAYAGELVKRSGLTAATISHHMSQLAEASLIRLEKKDTKVYYSVNKEMVEKCLEYYRKKLLG